MNRRRLVSSAIWREEHSTKRASVPTLAGEPPIVDVDEDASEIHRGAFHAFIEDEQVGRVPEECPGLVVAQDALDAGPYGSEPGAARRGFRFIEKLVHYRVRV